MYGKACTLGNDIPECVFNNPLALSPRSKPSALQCIRAFDTDTAGTCRIGPNKHGDACNQDGECASGRCLRELRICKGIDEGETCEPSFPDPCEPNHYCLPKREGVETTGSCAKVISAGKACTYSEACERGYYCAGPTLATRRCVAPFTVEDGFNTTVGPYMCKSANAVLAVSQQSSVNSIYTCVSANTTESLVGTECNPAAPPPPGFECVCSGRGSVYRLRTRAALCGRSCSSASKSRRPS
ncbi:hypothetical protein EON67_12580 [archaeon]|nr:MAG: hypothetical protein EON67_12580 [archaeon]